MWRLRGLTLPALPFLLAGLLSPAAQAAEGLAPRSWAGEWEVTMTYRDRDTGRVVGVDRVTDDICPHEPLGLALFQGPGSCRSEVTDTGLAVRCAIEVSLPACSAKATLALDVQRRDDALSGDGEWDAAVDGECGVGPVNRGQSIGVAAVRLSANPRRGCGTAASSVVQKFVLHPWALALSAAPFAALTLERVEVEGDAFQLDGAFTLAASSDGIDPGREPLRLEVGAFSTTIAARSFKLQPPNGDEPEAYAFEGLVGQGRVGIRLTPLGGMRFAFRAEGEGVGVGGDGVAFAVALAIGNDGGTVAALGQRGSHDDPER
jgi:hypothetical protein